MISIIIPVYNVSGYIYQCLSSVSAQSYTDLEVIIVDDCGKDDSMRKAEAFIDSYSGPISFRIVRHDRNKGLSAARNTGIDTATGEYVSFIDSDDYINTRMYEILAQAAYNITDKNAIVSCLYYIDNNGVILSPSHENIEKYIIPSERYADKLLKMEAPHMVWGKLYPKDIFNSIRFREGFNNEDILFALDSYPYVEKSKTQMLVLPQKLYYYRQRENSICHSTSDPFVLRVLKNDLIVIKSIKNKRGKEQIYDFYLNKFLSRSFSVFRDIRHKNNPNHKDFYSLSKGLSAIPNIEAKVRTSREEYRMFLFLKYIPKIYCIYINNVNKSLSRNG